MGQAARRRRKGTLGPGKGVSSGAESGGVREEGSVLEIKNQKLLGRLIGWVGQPSGEEPDTAPTVKKAEGKTCFKVREKNSGWVLGAFLLSLYAFLRF